MSETPADDEPLPPLPTKIRFEARYRKVPRARAEVSLGIFIALLLIVTAAGFQGFVAIGQFLTIAQQNMAKRAAEQPSSEPTPEVEITFLPSRPSPKK